MIKQTRRGFLKEAGSYALASSLAFGSGCASRGKKPNILLITIDALRADHLSCYGYHRNTSPNIDQLAREGVLFENCYSNMNITGPSLTSLFTGKYAKEHGVWFHDNRYMPYDGITLAHLLREGGYKTVGISGYPAVVNKHLGFDRGFDSFRALRGNGENADLFAEADAVTEYAMMQFETLKLQNKPFFVWIHYFDPHDPYAPPDRFKNKFADIDEFKDLPTFERDIYTEVSVDERRENKDFWISQYDSEIFFTDGEIRKVLNVVGTLFEDTLVVLTSDHGEQMGEGEYCGFGHPSSMRDCLYHVPLIIRDNKHEGKRIKELIQHFDVFSTVTGMVGLRAPRGISSKDLGPLVRGDVSVIREEVFGEVDRNAGCVIWTTNSDNELVKLDYTINRRRDYRKSIEDRVEELNKKSEHLNAVMIPENGSEMPVDNNGNVAQCSQRYTWRADWGFRPVSYEFQTVHHLGSPGGDIVRHVVSQPYFTDEWCFDNRLWNILTLSRGSMWLWRVKGIGEDNKEQFTQWQYVDFVPTSEEQLRLSKIGPEEIVLKTEGNERVSRALQQRLLKWAGKSVGLDVEYSDMLPVEALDRELQRKLKALGYVR